MIASGPGGPLPPIHSAGEVPTSANAAKAAPGAVSGAPGDARASVRAETAGAIDPARQAASAVGLPREETNERARAARGLVEPSRPAALMLAGAAPTEATPAGPPPTFEISILEKALAVASAPPPVMQPPPEPGSGGEPVDRPGEAEAASAETRIPGETPPDAPRGAPGTRSEAARPAAAGQAERPEPTVRETSAKVVDETATLGPARPGPEPTRT